MPNKPNKLNNKEFDQGLTLQELRVIIHALKMQELHTSVDPTAIDAIKSRIADLPSAEKLLGMELQPKQISAIIKEVGEIMHLIESYPKTNSEYKDRHQSVTGLPPRYRVLNWRKNMNKATKADSVKSLIKISENLDNIGQGILSNKIIACAKKIRNEENDEQYFTEVEKELIQAGFQDEANIVKEAGIGGFLGGIGGGLKEVFKNIWQGGKAGSLEQDFGSIAKQMGILLQKLQTLQGKASQSNNVQIAQRMKHLYDIVNQASLAWNKVIDGAKEDSTAVTQEAVKQPAQQQVSVQSPTNQTQQGQPATQPTQTGSVSQGQPAATQPAQKTSQDGTMPVNTMREFSDFAKRNNLTKKQLWGLVNSFKG